MSIIRGQNDPVLRAIAKPVPEKMFGTKELDDIIENMARTLDAEPDGVALAAPQIGISYRIFVVRYDRTIPPDTATDAVLPTPELGVFINPEIVKTSRRRDELEEGCLSVRGTYGKTLRFEQATVRARTASGKKFERGGGGILAQAFQHELDHLDGTLFIDHAIDLVAMPPPHLHEESPA